MVPLHTSVPDMKRFCGNSTLVTRFHTGDDELILALLPQQVTELEKKVLIQGSLDHNEETWHFLAVRSAPSRKARIIFTYAPLNLTPAEAVKFVLSV
jgi:hypothetical protein